MAFEFATATRIIFGPGKIREVGAIAKDFGKRFLIISGRDTKRASPLLHLLKEQDIKTVLFLCRGEPETAAVQEGVGLAKQEECEGVISFGGGSALDLGKAIAAMLTNEGELLDYLEVIGQGKALRNQSAPFIAIPTTAGTGAEVTRNAVLGSAKHRVKVSLRSPYMLAKVAIIDPELTYDLPPVVTATTGLDAITQLIEPYVSSRANPFTDSLCVEGLPRAARSIRRAFHDGHDANARSNMCIASLFGGLALANAGLGAVHGFAGPLGGMFPAPHGAVCAALLPHVMEANINALRERTPESFVIRRFDEVARIVTGSSVATARDGVVWARDLVAELKISSLGAYGITKNDSAAVVAKATQASSMKANPIELTHDELSNIFADAL